MVVFHYSTRMNGTIFILFRAKTKVIANYLEATNLVMPLGFTLSPSRKDPITTYSWIPSSIEIAVKIPFLDNHVINMAYQRETVEEFIEATITKVSILT